mgnify:CR=1 FL=1
MALDRKTLLPLLILLGVVFLVYAPTTRGLFVYDEIEAVVQNRMLFKTPLAQTLFTKNYFNISLETSYRPVVTLTYLVDGMLWRGPFGWRLTNLLLHLLCVGLLYAFLRMWRMAMMPAWIGAAFFGLHPIHVETVASVGFREDLLVGAGLLGMALSYAAWRNGRMKTAAAALIAGLVVFLAQMSKENAFMAPVLLLAVAGCDEANTWVDARRRWRTAFPLLIAVVAATALSLFIYFVLMYYPQPGDAREYSTLALWIRMPWIYLRHELLPLVIPYHLHPSRMVFLSRIGIVPIAMGWAVLLALIFAGVQLVRRWRGDALGLLWFAIMWLPTSNIIPLHNLVADRYAYVPDLGLGLLIGVALQRGLERLRPVVLEDNAEEVDERQNQQMLLIGAAAIVLVLCAVLTNRQLARWRDIETLWTYQRSIEPDSVQALHSLAYNAQQQSEMAAAQGNGNAAQFYGRQALEYSREATRLAPNDLTSMGNYANALLRAGQLDEARPLFEQILRLTPRGRIILIQRSNHSLGLIELQSRKPDVKKALAYFKAAQAAGYYEDPTFMRNLEKEAGK